jgi:hypothetical protein
MTKLRYTYSQVKALVDSHAAELAALKRTHAEAITRAVFLTAVLTTIEVKTRLAASERKDDK